MVGGVAPLRGSVRWAVNTRAWEPTEQEWLFASRCVSLEDKERINKFAFKADAKASMAGSLMLRKLAHLATAEPYDKITFFRDKHGRPAIKDQTLEMDFNISHQGNYTVLAAEIDNNLTVGVDIMHFKRRTGHSLQEFFRLMNKTCSVAEWNSILSYSSDEKRAVMFFRHWCLKESYCKGTGSGIRTDMRFISFKINTPNLSIEKPTTDSVLELDGVPNLTWRFHEWLLDPLHCVSVALTTPSKTITNIQPVPFTTLSWSELMTEAIPLLPPDADYVQTFMRKDASSRAHERD
ncbi:L-aminoadipate-semialdehyde dehydrogenase-phosphopantetheinyl transferase [Frankliniella fusca]|uniref:L-aminoadipate-semialdehyde dehydrogenase-phosphopantetheinyl transferase n=1 Tax=Frankliniella fusca TaxID=407009 RepID=A0AAE1LNS4_9NEOP|nr:L-aminoadipate-semialdehyde dehydrogenase-phosphopantetheinyl transferase [Frankliniella fusca]